MAVSISGEMLVQKLTRCLQVAPEILRVILSLAHVHKAPGKAGELKRSVFSIESVDKT